MSIKKFLIKICVNILDADFELTLFEKEDKKCVVKRFCYYLFSYSDSPSHHQLYFQASSSNRSHFRSSKHALNSRRSNRNISSDCSTGNCYQQKRNLVFKCSGSGSRSRWSSNTNSRRCNYYYSNNHRWRLHCNMRINSGESTLKVVVVQ